MTAATGPGGFAMPAEWAPHRATWIAWPRNKPEVLVAEVDPQIVETARQHWPFLRDRRIDAYGPITERSLEKR